LVNIKIKLFCCYYSWWLYRLFQCWNCCTFTYYYYYYYYY